jgi:hypothetical protein
MAPQGIRPNVPQLPGHIVELNGKVLDQNSPGFQPQPQAVQIWFKTQDRDPSGDNRTVSEAPVDGVAYRITGRLTDAYVHDEDFTGWVVEIPGGFSWLNIVSTDPAGNILARFWGYVSDGGLVAGRLWTFHYDSSGTLDNRVLTSESGQWP